MFVSSEEFPLIKGCNLAPKQIYISDHGNTIDVNDELLEELAENYIITVERTEILTDYPDYINIILAVDCPSVFFLKRNCQVKFSQGQHVFAVTKRNMTETIPSEFEDDVTI